ncbi:hypothetical protein GLX30_09985 [Streptomyces sp. Tu 2975]|uniref:hypothetical protein n=1 Tax=Streptomyces sp. Tu 2975 TaxID=2676871 RepID=UPI001359F6CB|nr:hypothetical protein [Streptomyces sp. Tu 2975]QIP84302.1 hypothetical protein GLX30_09985 [Streptomyces sp. Tu 2975]
MGVFSWFRRKPATAEEASAPKAAVGTPAEESGESEESGRSEVSDGTAEASVAAEPAEEVAPAVEATGSTDAAAETAVPPVDGDTTAAAVEIPRQQSAGEAADSEAGEGART